MANRFNIPNCSQYRSEASLDKGKTLRQTSPGMRGLFGCLKGDDFASVRCDAEFEAKREEDLHINDRIFEALHRFLGQVREI